MQNQKSKKTQKNNIMLLCNSICILYMQSVVNALAMLILPVLFVNLYL